MLVMGPKILLSDIRRLAKLQVTMEEAAAFFQLSRSTFRKMLEKDERARKVWEECRALGRISLRRKQIRLASTNATMGIWLGKQYLNQQDKQSLEHTGPGGGPVQTLDLTKLSSDERRKLRSMAKRVTKQS